MLVAQATGPDPSNCNFSIFNLDILVLNPGAPEFLKPRNN